jgi:hypothetical protein
MLKSTLAAAIVMAGLAPSAHAKVQNTQEFAIDIPCKMNVEREVSKTKIGDIPTVTYKCTASDTAYEILVTDYPNGSVRPGNRDAMLDALSSPPKVPVTVHHRTAVTVAGSSGIDITYTIGGSTSIIVRQRVLLIGDRHFKIQWIGDYGAEFGPAASRFFDSFRPH